MGESKGLPIVATTSASEAAPTVPEADSKHTLTLLSSDAKSAEPASSSSAIATTGIDNTADSKGALPSSGGVVSSSSSGLSTGFARAALPHHLPPLAALKVCMLLLIYGVYFS